MTVTARVTGFYGTPFENNVPSVRVTLRSPFKGTSPKTRGYARVGKVSVSGEVIHDPNYLGHDYVFFPEGANAQVLRNKLKTPEEQTA